MLQQALGLAWSNAGVMEEHARLAPTLEALPLRIGRFPSAVLAAGAGGGAIVSEHGNILERLVFPVGLAALLLLC